MRRATLLIRSGVPISFYILGKSVSVSRQNCLAWRIPIKLSRFHFGTLPSLIRADFRRLQNRVVLTISK